MAAKGDGVDVQEDVDPALAAFMAWSAERTAPMVDYDAFGTTWQIPRSMPARLWFDYQELRAAGRGLGDLTYGELDELAPAVIPADVLERWRALPMSLDELYGEVIKVIYRYLFPPKDADASGEAPARSTSETSSSDTSDSSSATSSGSIGSTSSALSKKAKKGKR